jgi:hypothetical protein
MNIPTTEVINIIKNIMETDLEIVKATQDEIIKILRTIIGQNYFQFNEQHYKQIEGLAMGAPTSAILAEAYIQHMEHTQLYPILIKHQIMGYFRYVDDIRITYNRNKTKCTKWRRLKMCSVIALAILIRNCGKMKLISAKTVLK